MSVSELQVSYRTDEEHTGQIIACVRSGDFSARGAAWFGRVHVKDTFVAGLRTFPLDANSPPVLEGGFWSKGNRDVLEQCHLRITIKPFYSNGTLLVQVDLASEVWASPDADLQNFATVRFRAEYPAIDAFATEFEEVLDGRREVATLKGVAS